MNAKDVIIYAYSDTRGVFFYNGTNATRADIDALREDNKENLSKYEGYKLKKYEGIGAEEAEIFTADKGVGDGVFITGSRIPEKYIDLTAVGAAGSVKTNFQNAKNFHKVGEWYTLNIQIHNTWVKCKAMLKNYKIEPNNVYKKPEVTASYLIPDITSDEYWHTAFDASKLPGYTFTADSATANLVSPKLEIADMDAAGWPILKYTLKFSETPSESDTYNKRIQTTAKVHYYDDNGVLQEASLTGISGNIYYNSEQIVLVNGYWQSGYELDSNCEYYVWINTNPTNRKYTTKIKMKKTADGTYETVNVKTNQSFTSQVPSGKKIEDIVITTVKYNNMTGAIEWEAV